MIARLAACACLGIAGLAVLPAAAAADGELDPGFGTGGAVTISWGPGVGSEAVSSIAVLGDGRIVGSGMGAGNGVGVVRLTPAGVPDPTFASGGQFYAKAAPSGFSGFGGAAFAPDGTATVGGFYFDMGGFESFAMRVTPAGELDPAFGNDPPNATGDGIVMYDIGGTHDQVRSVALDPAGRTYLSGHTGDNTAGGANDAYVARLGGDGALDTSLGGTGFVLTNAGTDDRGLGALFDASGNLLVAGSIDGQLSVLRYRPDGSLDPGFGGGDGIAPVGLGTQTPEIASLALQPDGRIVLAASTGAPFNFEFGVARLLPDGAQDPSFAGDGSLTMEIGQSAFVSDVAIADDGRIVLAGTVTGSGDDQVALLRLLPNGTPDPQFGEGGLVFLGTADAWEGGSAVAIQPDRKIVVGASWFDGASADAQVMRVLGDTYAPDTKITKAKRKVKRKRKTKIRFQVVGDVNARFECSLKQPGKKGKKHKKFKPCTSPYRKKVKRKGKHTFRVRAIDPAGNVDPTPAKKRFRVKAR